MREPGTAYGHAHKRNPGSPPGGMRDGLKFRGVLPGGASTDFLVNSIWTLLWITNPFKKREAALARHDDSVG